MTTPESRGPTLSERVRSLVGIDVRSLACLRIGLGAVILADLISRVGDLSDHYSDWGVLPRVAVEGWLPLRTDLFPAYFASGSTGWSAFLFLVTAASAVALLFGWKTRLATIACWYLVSSLQVRNPAVLHGGDNILRIFLLWSIFLPLGSVWSWDAKRSASSRQVVSVASLAIQIQLCFVYFFTALYKSDPVWTEDRSAVLRSLHLDHLTTPLGVFLRGFPGLLEVATAGTLALEFIGPLLLWVPFFIGPLRTGITLIFVSFHLMLLAPTFDLGIFPWVAAVAWSVFLPTWFWDQISQAQLPAIDRPANVSGSPLRTLALNGGAGALLLVALLWNIRDQDPERFAKLLPGTLDPILQSIGIQQSWKMFAPRPPAETGWYVMPAQLIDGTRVDLWSEAAVTFSKPPNVNDTFINSRWVKYLMNMSDVEYLPHRPLLTQYLCRRWNRRSGQPAVAQLEVIFMLETYETATGVSPPKPQSLGGQVCSTAGP